MSMRELFALLAAAGMLASCGAPGSSSPGVPESRLGIGRLATSEEVGGWDIDIRPDGSGLPAGSGSVAAGRATYDARCASCHGAGGAGATAPALVGGMGTLATRRPSRTIGSFWPYAPTVYDYIYRAMPWDRPMSMTPSEVYAVTAYLLNANKLLADDAVMDAKTLPAVRMPNRGGFIHAREQAVVRGSRCMRPAERQSRSCKGAPGED